MYAVIETGGKQIRVEVGQEIFVEKLDVQPDEEYVFDKVLMIGDGKTKIGKPYVKNATVKAKVIKNKVAPPFRQAEFDIMFGEGISKEGELVDYGVKLDIVDKAGAWFSYEETKLGQGRENVKQKFKDEPELAAEIEEKIKVAMGVSNVMVMDTSEINDTDA